ncbi:hypothetical protein SAMN05444411_10759 [Lutibacter oricola]|uniref:Uncharacterized protein n=1 Tax=Lutibacter oricola TaxID=762486 RepID=A0A1H3D5E1_9FLAO|nr:hypothetical protein [Lutibacter oricola]SDX61722.1 hypothetical protein SAMN05444411_10759 [Lutibacter oricola]
MKTIKFLIALSLFSTLFISCTSDSIDTDEQLYSLDQVRAEGEEGNETYADGR